MQVTIAIDQCILLLLKELTYILHSVCCVWPCDVHAAGMVQINPAMKVAYRIGSISKKVVVVL